MTTLMVVVTAARLAAQQIDELAFVNEPVRDVLVAIGRATGRSVVPDETVGGTASFYFADTDFESALATIAAEFNLFLDSGESVTEVSGVRVAAEGGGLFSVDCTGVDISAVLRHLSREAAFPVLFAGLPPVPITYHVRAATLDEIVGHIVTQLPDFDVRSGDDALVIARRTSPVVSGPGATDRIRITHDRDRYSVDVSGATFHEVAERLFDAASREFQMLKRSSPSIERFAFADKEFDSLLTLLCERADAQYAVVDGVYYISDAAPLTALARMRETVLVRARYLPVASLLDALPPEVTAGTTLRPDRDGNALSVTGAPDAVDRVVRLVGAIDVPPEGETYRRFTVQNVSVSALRALVPRHLSALEITPAPDGASFITSATDAQAADLAEFLAILDVGPSTVPVALASITVKQLMDNPPASAPPGRIIPTGDPTRFFFRGTPAEQTRFFEDLEVIDRSPPRIRYQLLVVQYEDGSERDFSFDMSNSVAGPDATQTFIGAIGNLLSLNFDVIASFGYQFAARLDARIANSTATVLADTTLTGLSGQSVRFQSTNTYRYRDTAVDPQSGDVTATGVIREITSGLILRIDGWANGTDEVTMDVSATLSKRGSDTSDGNPPRTSEKVVDTHVRSSDGTPVVLSGIIQQEVQSTTSDTPLLARIPLVGLLFRSRDETVENTELAVYIIPHVDRPPPAEPEVGAALMDLYDRFVRGQP